ncbi:MAG: 5-formyltetrahydrofolate cyclo-ligase [Candidatus Rokubacteria bacterium]|nr:5-formyltetrahydrofolate cyclo-ligase [Candidatus Rokubacteria bacterium]
MPTSEGAAAVKAELRRAGLARREAIPAERRAELSAVIFATVVALEAFQRALTVLAYCSFGSEPVTDAFLRAVLGRGKSLVLPRVRRGTRSLDVYRVTDPARELRPGVWGIREPDPAACAPVPLGAVDFVLVPGVVFDARGGRIGYGAGYYDRLLRGLADGVPLVAAAFEVQLVDEVPMEPHDRPIDRIVTERRVIGGAPR